MRLENIGFYTLSDHRAAQTSSSSPLWRCELILTDKCNFNCPYCRGLRKDIKGTLPLKYAKEVVDYWTDDNLQNIRFSGGEPTCYPDLLELVRYTKDKGVRRIALSTNGSADLYYYKMLYTAGVNDFSISLDACCAADNQSMTGVEDTYDHVINIIEELSKLTYVTVGTVLNDDNLNKVCEIVSFAETLGVSDIRVIPAAQHGPHLPELMQQIPQDVLNHLPILRYRVNRILEGKGVRGITAQDSHTCYLMLDDMAIAGNYHFPCIIYMREGGNPVGKVGSNMRKEREVWVQTHNCFDDPICRHNCLDVCVDYNNKVRELQK